MHKCQGTSQLLPLPGQSFNRTYRLRDTVMGTPGVAPRDLFEGIDTSLAGLARVRRQPRRLADLTAGDRRRLRHAVVGRVARARRRAARGAAGAAARRPGWRAVRALRARAGRDSTLSADARYEIDFRLAPKESQFQQALVLAYGMRLEALADDGVVMRGQPVKLSFAMANNGPADVALAGVDARRASTAHGASCAGSVAQGRALTCAGERRRFRRARRSPARTGRRARMRRATTSSRTSRSACRSVRRRSTRRFRLLASAAPTSRSTASSSTATTMSFAGEKRMELSVAPAFSVRLAPGDRRHSGSRGESAGGASGAAARDVQVVVTNQQGPAAGTRRAHGAAGWTRRAPPRAGRPSRARTKRRR